MEEEVNVRTVCVCGGGGGGGGGIEGSFPSANVYHLNVVVSGIKSLEDTANGCCLTQGSAQTVV